MKQLPAREVYLLHNDCAVNQAATSAHMNCILHMFMHTYTDSSTEEACVNAKSMHTNLLNTPIPIAAPRVGSMTLV